MGRVKYLPYQGESTKEKEPELDRVLCATCGEEWHTHLTKKGTVRVKYREHVKTGTTVNREVKRHAHRRAQADRRREVRGRSALHTMHWLRRAQLERSFEEVTDADGD